MARPSWTYPSNVNLGTYNERTQVRIPILVFDDGDISDPTTEFNETHMFNNLVDSSVLPNYSDLTYFWVKSTGMPQHNWLGQPENFNKYSPLPNNYVFKFPRNQVTIYGDRIPPSVRAKTDTEVRGFLGVAIDGVPFKSPNSRRIASISGKYYTENDALFPIQAYQDDNTNPTGPFADGSGIIQSDRNFYYITDPRFVYDKDPTKHSPIIGYAFDGNPIYGPYGYSNKFRGDYDSSARYNQDDIVKKNNNEDIFYVALADNRNISLTNTSYWRLAEPTEPFQIMQSSYRISDVQRANGTLPDGSYIEDFEFVAGLGDLDEHNGIGGGLDEAGIPKPYISPEYPNGTYAYFVTVDPDDLYLPRYPYIIGPKYFQEPLLPNGGFDYPGDINIEVISGQLPPGLRISGHTIVGVPFEVSTLKTFRFVLRATNASGLSDRTYSITIDGSDNPQWVTPAGDLDVGVTGSRTTQYKKLIDLVAVAGDTSIKITSVNRLTKGGILSSLSNPSSIASDTKILSIDPLNKRLLLSKPLTGSLPLGGELFITYIDTHTNLFVLDNDYVNYQLSAIDSDTATGQKLTYYVPPRGGQLPLGLSLSPDGVISGFTKPILSNDKGGYNGNYDMQLYDKYAYDYGVRPYNGFDSFLYDGTVYDYSDLIQNPRKLNRYYQFIVRVTDGLSYTDRKFRIYVVGDDMFRSDTTIMEVGTRVYTADITPIRKPIWLTPSYLGRRRANNYITTYLDTYDSNTLRGIIGYVLDPTNDDGTLSQLPPGMRLDQISGEIYGDVPYQPAVTKNYKFTVRAIRYDPDNPLYGYSKITIGTTSAQQNVVRLESVTGLRIGSLVNEPTHSGYITPGTVVTAINVTNKTITLSTPLLKIMPAGINLVISYVISSAKTFNIDIIGEIDSTIDFVTPGDLGTIPANFVSELSVVAKTNIDRAVLTYTLIGGKLPPGLTLVNDGTIQGKVNQYATESSPGLTTFDNNTTSFDEFNTSVDRQYTFIVLAEDQFQYSAITKVFTVTVVTPNNLLYSNIYVKPFIKTTKRLELTDFFTNPDIFERDRIYRPSDPRFGVQNELKMLLYAGIETKDANYYVSALGRSSKKRYRFGKVKKSVAKTPGTNDIIYEAVYVEILDNMENENGSLPEHIEINRSSKKPSTADQSRRDLWDSHFGSDLTEDIADSGKDQLGRLWTQDKVMSADYDGQLASDSNKSNIFGNSTTNIRKKLQNVGETERNFLPLWMRTPQTFSGVEQGFTRGIILCYALPGQGDRIVTNIKNLGIDFKTIDFTVDRVIIDSVKGETGDKYIAFAAREIING